MNNNKLLVVEDDLGLQSQIKWCFENYDVCLANDRKSALEQVRIHQPAVVTLDLGLPPHEDNPSEGFATLEQILELSPNTKVIVVTGQNERENAVKAIGIGAYDFYAKPFEPEIISLIVNRAFRLEELEDDNQRLQNSQVHEPFDGVVACSPQMQSVCKAVEKVAPSDATVLLLGESGTGKELCAKALHTLGRNNGGNFVAINCAAISPDLLESQLFGYAKGAFTGATSAHNGFFIEADKGTLLLDEIGELPLALQGKLLRVIESGEFYRVGETQVLKSGARIIAATNKNLRHEIASEHFRSDLFYRLSILNISLPALRAREQDVYLLLDFFIKLYANSVPPFMLDDEAHELWGSYDYPGNIRELRNIVIRLGTKYPGQKVNRQQLKAEMETRLSSPSLASNGTDLSDEMLVQKIKSNAFDLDKLLGDIEGRSIQLALELNGNNVSKAAKALKINRTTLYSRVQKLETQ